MIDRTLLYRNSVITKGGRGALGGARSRAWRRAETFSLHDLRNHGKHGKIERKFTNVITSVFSRTIHERNLRSRLRKVFHERGTFVIYERDYVVSFMFVARTWFTNVITSVFSFVGLRSWFTNVITYTVELNVSHGLRSTFNLDIRSLETEHGTSVEQAVITARNHGMMLFYHLFSDLTVGGWMLFRISPWGSLTAKTHVITVRFFMFSFSISRIILQMHYVITNVG
jgi:hypothetical protein